MTKEIRAHLAAVVEQLVKQESCWCFCNFYNSENCGSRPRPNRDCIIYWGKSPPHLKILETDWFSLPKCVIRDENRAMSKEIRGWSLSRDLFLMRKKRSKQIDQQQPTFFQGELNDLLLARRPSWLTSTCFPCDRRSSNDYLATR